MPCATGSSRCQVEHLHLSWSDLQDGCNDEDPQCGSVVAIKFMVKPSELVSRALQQCCTCQPAEASCRILPSIMHARLPPHLPPLTIGFSRLPAPLLKLRAAVLIRLQEGFKGCLQKLTEKAQDEDGLIMLKFAKSERQFCSCLAAHRSRHICTPAVPAACSLQFADTPDTVLCVRSAWHPRKRACFRTELAWC